MDVPGKVPASPVMSVLPVDVSVLEEIAPKELASPRETGEARFTAIGLAIVEVTRTVAVMMVVRYFMVAEVSRSSLGYEVEGVFQDLEIKRKSKTMKCVLVILAYQVPQGNTCLIVKIAGYLFDIKTGYFKLLHCIVVW